MDEAELVEMFTPPAAGRPVAIRTRAAPGWACRCPSARAIEVGGPVC
jgi:hypothetical protein